MREGAFKEGDLIKCDWQYTIKHVNVKNFSIGEKIFLKSNPEHSMIVHHINENDITVMWYNKLNEIQLHEFPPECILQYKYAGLVTYKDKFNIALN